MSWRFFASRQLPMYTKAIILAGSMALKAAVMERRGGETGVPAPLWLRKPGDSGGCAPQFSSWRNARLAFMVSGSISTK